MSDERTIITNHKFNRDEAFATIKKNRSAIFFVRGGSFLETRKDEIGRHGFDASCCIKVSKPNAIKYVDDMLTEGFNSRGAKIEFSIHTPRDDKGKTYIFIG